MPVDCELTVSPFMNNQRVLQAWRGVSDTTVVTNPLVINQTNVNYTFTATLNDANGFIASRRTVNFYVEPINVTFGFANDSADTTVLTGDPVVFLLVAFTRRLSISFNVDFGDNTSSLFMLTDSNQTISKAYAFAGVYTVTMKTLNTAYSSVIPTYNITLNVTGRPSCSSPVLSIDNQGSFDNPAETQRSATLTLNSVTIMSCAFNNTNTKIWTLNEVDSLSGALIGSPIDMTLDSTKFAGYNQGILVVYPNALGYGRYMFKYTVTITYTKNAGLTYLTLQSEVSTYIQISPTGLNVFGLPKGILQQSYGLYQQILLDAGSNTKDLDYYVDPRTLYYQFYCQVIPSGQATSYFTDVYSIVTQYNQTNFFQVKDTTTTQTNIKSTECLESMFSFNLILNKVLFILILHFKRQSIEPIDID
jgi:hypothetical protein